MNRLAGKTAIVTGGAVGIGWAVVWLASDEAKFVTGGDRHQWRLHGAMT
jgi:NAD(P)-dependent dehydrogenase (short-subunit alcohol dehydrogenase family)